MRSCTYQRLQVCCAARRSAVEDMSLANGAAESVVDAHDPTALQHALPAGGKAWLADVVRGLVQSWATGPVLVLAGVVSHREAPVSEAEQRIAFAVLDAGLQFSHFLLCLGEVRLQLEQSGVVSEQALLRLEKLFHER